MVQDNENVAAVSERFNGICEALKQKCGNEIKFSEMPWYSERMWILPVLKNYFWKIQIYGDFWTDGIRNHTICANPETNASRTEGSSHYI